MAAPCSIGGTAKDDLVSQTDAWDALAALDEQYRLNYRRLLRFCERRVADPHRAEEVVQETFAQALRSFHLYDRDRPMWPWLCKIAARVAYRERSRTASESPTDMRPNQFDLEAPVGMRPNHVSDEGMLLRTAMSKLPPRQRTALALRYVHDLSTAQAAGVMELDDNAFVQLLWRARRRLGVEYARLVSDLR